jgi:hypothetical protein
MRLPRRILRRLTRPALAVVAVFAQLVAATGAPVFPPPVVKAGSVPFPCQNHPCGCSTSKECWAGDCCCFTLVEKVAWAEARGVEPPAHARAIVEARKAPPKPRAKKTCCAGHEKPSCCEGADECPAEPVAATVPAAPAVKWVSAAFARKCRGEGPAGLLKMQVSVPPAPASEVRAPRPACGRVVAFDADPFLTFVRPPIPPPRAS